MIPTTNEKGLSMAGLNFPDNADYKPASDDGTNVASFEFIPWVLGQFETVDEVRRALVCPACVVTDEVDSKR